MHLLISQDTINAISVYRILRFDCRRIHRARPRFRLIQPMACYPINLVLLFEKYIHQYSFIMSLTVIQYRGFIDI